MISLFRYRNDNFHISNNGCMIRLQLVRIIVLKIVIIDLKLDSLKYGIHFYAKKPFENYFNNVYIYKTHLYTSESIDTFFLYLKLQNNHCEFSTRIKIHMVNLYLKPVLKVNIHDF